MCRTEILIDKTYEVFSRCYPQFKFTRKSFEKEDVISPSCYEDYIIKEYDCGIELRDYIN